MIVLSAMTINNWYNEPLNLNDIIAGGTLISLAIIFMLIYIVTSFVLYRESHVATGFRYLFSSSINNMFLLLNYALFPGMLILFKKQMPAFGRRLCQVYFDTMWFSMCYHTLLVAWTRYEAVCHPCQFRKQRNSTTYVLCLMCYVIAFIQSMIVYFQPWYVTFYYEASAYGMIAEDTDLYLGGGKSRFFIIFHLIIFVSTFSLYSCALFLLFKYSRQTRNNFMGRTLPSVTRSIRQSSVFASANLSMRAETKLILPCICNAIVFLIGQMVITIGISEGRWTIWLILVLFTFTASVDSLTLLLFSSTVRRGVVILIQSLFFCRKKTNVVVIKRTNAFPQTGI